MGDTPVRKTRMTVASDTPEGKIMIPTGDIPDYDDMSGTWETHL